MVFFFSPSDVAAHKAPAGAACSAWAAWLRPAAWQRQADGVTVRFVGHRHGRSVCRWTITGILPDLFKRRQRRGRRRAGFDTGRCLPWLTGRAGQARRELHAARGRVGRAGTGTAAPRPRRRRHPPARREMTPMLPETRPLSRSSSRCSSRWRWACCRSPGPRAATRRLAMAAGAPGGTGAFRLRRDRFLQPDGLVHPGNDFSVGERGRQLKHRAAHRLPPGGHLGQPRGLDAAVGLHAVAAGCWRSACSRQRQLPLDDGRARAGHDGLGQRSASSCSSCSPPTPSCGCTPRRWKAAT